MKKTFLTSVCLIIASFCFAQTVSSVGISINKFDKADEFITSPHIKIDKNKHAWVAGPILLYSFGDQVESRNAVKLTGFQVGYEHFLHGSDQKWNLYHSFDLFAQRIKDTQNSQFFDPGTNSFVANEIVQIDNTLFLTASAGVLWNLSEKISFNQSIGIGANAVFQSTESSIDSFNDTFFKQRWLMKTGIRYRVKGN